MTYDEINKNIVVTLGIDKLPEEQQKETLERLGAVIYQEVISRCLDLISDEDKDAFIALIEKNPDPITIITFLSGKVSNLDDIVREEAQKLHDEAKEVLAL